MKWALIIYVASWYGVANDRAEFPTKEECFEALSHVKIKEDSMSLAYCKPLRDKAAP